VPAAHGMLPKMRQRHRFCLKTTAKLHLLHALLFFIMAGPGPCICPPILNRLD
jgi:hypothetical protein